MYSFSTVIDGPMDAAVQHLTDTLKEHGPFGIVSDINVAGILKAKMGVERRPYRILGACNPKLANQVIEGNEDAGVLLPCNILVSEQKDGRVKVVFQDPVALLSVVDSPAAREVGETATAMLKKVVDNL